jgi:hypothetical protein
MFQHDLDERKASGRIAFNKDLTDQAPVQRHHLIAANQLGLVEEPEVSKDLRSILLVFRAARPGPSSNPIKPGAVTMLRSLDALEGNESSE